MIMYYICVVFALFAIVASSTTPENRCCSPDHPVLLLRGKCWNPTTNATSPIRLKCNQTARFKSHQFVITKDLLLNLKLDSGFDELFDTNTYCVGNATNIRDVSLKNISLVALLCLEEEEERILDDRVLGYCMIISILFLAPTAVIYSALAELRDVQGKSIINFCISLAIGQGILVMLKLMEYSDMALCATRGFLTYFFLVAAFFWTNAIAIQCLLQTRRPATIDYSWKEFKWYFLYAWGCPTVLTTIMAIINFMPGRHSKPGIGLSHCWFYNDTQQWYYMFSVMSILVAANICIFIYTSVVIWRLSFSSSHIRALKYKLVMTIRLFVLLGVPWLFEMISSLAGQHVIWAITDIFNCLQGIFIFLLLVVFRRRVVKLMYKHGWLDCISGYVEKHLAEEDDEENVVQHTDVPMSMTDKSMTKIDR